MCALAAERSYACRNYLDPDQRFEVHSVPPDSVLSVYVAGNPASLGLLSPTMVCSCVSPPTSLCGAPLFLDYPNAAFVTLVSINYAYRNLSFSLTLPAALGTFAIQAVMMPLDLSNFVSTNAYSITTF